MKKEKTTKSVQILEDIKNDLNYLKLDLKCSTYSELILYLMNYYKENKYNK